MTVATRPATAAGTPGFWWWTFQRFSGLLLIVLVLLHGWFTHFVPIASVEAGLQPEPVVFEMVKKRLGQAAFVAIDFSLLAIVLFHGLYGLRNILLEWAPAARRKKAVEVSIWALGIAAFAVGARTLLVFILG